MKTGKYKYYLGPYFPWQFSLLGGIVLIIGLTLEYGLIFNLIIILISLVIFTGHYGLEIDFTNKTFMSYASFLGIKSGKRKTFDAVEKIFINSRNIRETLHSRSNYSGNFRYIEYKSFLKFSNGRKIGLISRKNKDKLLKQIRNIAKDLKAEIVDFSI
ncbi:hypothetical protein BH23BAC1_BH23BAC1_37440 [soil metagenome]